MGLSVARRGTGSSNQGPASPLLAAQRKEEVAAGPTEAAAIQRWGLLAAVLLPHRHQQQKWVRPRLPECPALKHRGRGKRPGTKWPAAVAKMTSRGDRHR